MGGIFKKPKPPEAPKIEAPPIIMAEEAGESEIRRQRRKRGFENTFLMGTLKQGQNNLKTELG
jgi:hypothetical protein